MKKIYHFKLQKEIKICVCILAFLTSWYTEGLEREGTVKDNILLCPSLSTISCERERQEDNEKVFLWARNNSSLFCVCPKPLKSVCLSLQAPSSVMCGCLCISQISLPVYVRFLICVFVSEHTRTHPGVLVSLVCTLMSNTLMGANCVE